MMKIFYAYDENGNELLVDTTKVEINPSGCNMKIKTYPIKRLDSGDKRGIYQNYKVIAGHIPEEKRDEFLQVCKRLMTNYRATKKKKEKKRNALKMSVQKIKI